MHAHAHTLSLGTVFPGTRAHAHITRAHIQSHADWTAPVQEAFGGKLRMPNLKKISLLSKVLSQLAAAAGAVPLPNLRHRSARLNIITFL